jgi:hypothetical protein
MYSGRIAFIKGVDQHGAQPPPGFPHRFAVLTWFENGPDYADPWPLVRQAVPEIARILNSETVIAEYVEYKRSGFLWTKREKKVSEAIPWEELMRRDDDSLHESSFPDGFRFESGGKILLIEQSEMWNQVGGPRPYHDSLTLSFFSPNPLSSEENKHTRSCGHLFHVLTPGFFGRRTSRIMLSQIS